MNETPKYPKPKIMLIDMAQAASESLVAAGYNVSNGSFGSAYKVKPSNGLHVVDCNSDLPNVEEQEIVFASLRFPSPIEREVAEPNDGVTYFWTKGEHGSVDPRPLEMMSVQTAFNRILYNGGIFFICLSSRYAETYLRGANGYGGVETEKEIPLSNWSMLEPLNSLRSSDRSGHEVTFDAEFGRLSKLLEKGYADSGFSCSVNSQYSNETEWETIAVNKFGEPVAGIQAYESRGKTGWLIVTPELPRLSDVIVDLVQDYFAILQPELFPFLDGMRWVHKKEYELPAINELSQKIADEKESHEQTLLSLNDQIQTLKATNKDWYLLLNGTGDDLVLAVKRTLESFGFEQVVDVDQVAEAEGTTGSLKEDLRIEDETPYIVIDVKGVGGVVEDGEATQAEKHALMRQNETGKVHKALSIINAQRNIPPKDRDPKPYRDEIVANAKLTGLGLMTTWDLHCLSRNKVKLGWPNEQIHPIFRRSGRIEPIPEHYNYVGYVLKVWKLAFGFLPETEIPQGSRLAIEIGDSFVELDCSAIKVDDIEVAVAEVGSNCGIAFACKDNGVKKGQRIFLVEPANA